MESKKTKYEYANIKGGKAIPVTPEVLERLKEIGDNIEVGLYASGIAPQENPLAYRESRSLLKTNAMLMGRGEKGRERTGLAMVGTLNPTRYSYSKRAGILMNYLIYCWQTEQLDRKGRLVIKNLSKVARALKTTPQRVKEALAEVVAYEYPVITVINRGGKKDTQDTVESKDTKMFEITFISKVDKGVIKTNGFASKEDIERLSAYCYLAVKPCETYRTGIGMDGRGRKIQGKRVYDMLGLGNVLTPIENIARSINLSLWGKKLLDYMGGNKPEQKIGLKKLLIHLGVTDEDLREQGKPRYKKNIDKGLEELKGEGYLEKWAYTKSKDMYYWKYTAQAFRHPDIFKGKTGYNINTEKRGKKTPKNTRQ